MRGFAAIQHLATTAFIFVAAAFWGICMIPSAAILLWTSEFVADFSFVEQAIGFGLAGGAAFLAFGLCTIFLSGFIGMLTKPRLLEARVPLQSYTTIRWALASILHRFALLFLRHLTPTWIGNTHYRMMGAKIGKGVQINSDNLNDAWTLTIGDGTVVGGHAVLNGHLTEQGELVLAPIVIGKNCLIGGQSTVQPGCVIGDGATLAYNAVLPKWTEIPAGEVWGGIPAKCIRRADGSKPE